MEFTRNELYVEPGEDAEHEAGYWVMAKTETPDMPDYPVAFFGTSDVFDHEAKANAVLHTAASGLYAALLVQMDATRYEYAWPKSDTESGLTLREIEVKCPFLTSETRTPDARMKMLREHADKLSSAALAKARGESEAAG